MNKEDKQLLLKDLVARLPYGVKCTTKSLWNGIYTIEGYKDDKFFLDCPVYDEGDDEWMIESVVPYLRPMSSMTEGEYNQLYIDSRIKEDSVDILDALANDMDAIDWLNAHHFDYRGLIEKGLAIAVDENNNPYKE